MRSPVNGTAPTSAPGGPSAPPTADRLRRLVRRTVLFAAAVGAGFLLAALFQGPAAADGMRSGSGAEPRLEIGGLVEPVTRLMEAARPDQDRQRAAGADHRRGGAPDAPVTRAIGDLVAPRDTTPTLRAPRSTVSVPLPRVDSSGIAERESLRPASSARADHRPARRVPAARPPADPVRQAARAVPELPAMPRPADTPTADLITAPLPRVADTVHAPIPRVTDLVHDAVPRVADTVHDAVPRVAEIVHAPIPHVTDVVHDTLPRVTGIVHAPLPHVADLVTAALPHVIGVVSAVPIPPVVTALCQVTDAALAPARDAMAVPAAPPPPSPPRLGPAAEPLAAPAPAPAVPTPPAQQAEPAASAEPALAPAHAAAAAATAASPWLSVVEPAHARASTGHPAARPDPVTVDVDLPGRPVTPADQDAAGADDGSPPGPGLVRPADRQAYPRAGQLRDLVPLLVESRAPAPIARPG
ncbi:hypothetical protein [Micromonospora sp. NPDC049204]|uniref:hypothetical protein n=1 Tax=Micromonospora sp. NPDC049204 TaxID=3154351 RepID=UPI0034017038